MTGNRKSSSHDIPTASLRQKPEQGWSYMLFCVLVSKHKRLHTVVLLVFGLDMKFQLTVEPKCYLGTETGMSYKGGTRKEHSHRGQAEISKQAVVCLITLVSVFFLVS